MPPQPKYGELPEFDVSLPPPFIEEMESMEIEIKEDNIKQGHYFQFNEVVLIPLGHSMPFQILCKCAPIFPTQNYVLE